MNSKKKITIFTAETGHLSIAQAIKSILDSRYDVQVADVSSSLFSLYYPIYQYFPDFFKVPFKLSELKQSQRIIKAFLNRSYKHRIADILATQRPDLVISTYCLANSVIESYQKKIKYPFINIITDPRTFHLINPSTSAINFTFDQKASKKGKEYGFDASSFVVSGWFVRKEYSNAYDKKAIRKKLKLDTDKLTLLVAAGSEGTNFVLKILPTFIHSSTPVNVIFSCGHNQQLYALIQKLNNVNKHVRKQPSTQFIALKYTNKLYQYMQASDLVIGKAGPNLLFESVASKKPFFAITHISGQEDGNLDIIKEYKIGYVEENYIKANQLLSKILKKPEELSKFYPSLQKLSDHNKKAETVLLDTVNRLLKQELK